MAVRPTLDDIAERFAATGLRRVADLKVTQVFAADHRELLDKVRARSLSPLRQLPDVEYERGLQELERDAVGGHLGYPIVEHLDLVVLGARRAGTPA